MVLTLIAGMGTRTKKVETLIPIQFTLRVSYFENEPDILGHQTIYVVKHEFFETRKLTGTVLDYGCWLSFQGKDYGEAGMDDSELNYKAREISDKANAYLTSIGSPFDVDYDIASVWATECDETELFVDVSVWHGYGQREGGFLTYTNTDHQEEAWIHIPVSFYDFILKSVVDGKEIDLSNYTYPNIYEVGGYRVLPEDPNGLANWLANYIVFLKHVYQKELELTATPGLYDYTTSTQKQYISSYGCQQYNYKGVCVDRGPNYKNYTDIQENQIEVVLGTLVIK